MLNNCKNSTIPRYSFPFPLQLINLGDVHFGNSACDKQFFEGTVNVIANSPNTYWISTGDMLEINTFKGKHYDPESLELNEEFERIVDILKPIAHKCLGFVGSNHSARIHKLAGLNFDQVLAKTLSIPYLGSMGLIGTTLAEGNRRIMFTYYIAMYHGRSNAITLGSKANSMSKLSDIFPNVDLVLEGHTHTFMTSSKEIQIIDPNHNKLKTMTTHMCICGHCLDWATSYATDLKCVPTPKGFPFINLNNTYKKIDIRLLTPNQL